MTSPWGNPAPLPNPPRTWPIVVPVESCCGVLVGEEHDCPAFAAEAMAAFSAPIVLPAHSTVPCLTDPALQVWRPGPDMVEAMSPPIRWSITTDGVEVGL